MISVPQHIQSLDPYKPGKSSDLDSFKKYRAIICSNENNLGPSPKAMEAIREASANVHFYPDPQGEKLVDKLCEKHARSFEEFVLSNGLDGLLYSLFKAFTLPGDEVISSENSFVAFNKFSKMNNVDLTLVPMTESYELDLDRMLAAVGPKTKIVYICNPNNPTGTGIKLEALQDFISEIPDHVLVVVDEAYIEFASDLDPDFPDSSSFKHPNVLSLRTLSKIYGLAGLRIGYGVGSKHVIDALKKVKLVFNPNSIAQAAAIAALDDVDHMQATLSNNRKWLALISETLSNKSIVFLPSYSNFLTLVFPEVGEAIAFNRKMDRNGILLRKLDGFGMPYAVRISIGNETEMSYVYKVLQSI